MLGGLNLRLGRQLLALGSLNLEAKRSGFFPKDAPIIALSDAIGYLVIFFRVTDLHCFSSVADSSIMVAFLSKDGVDGYTNQSVPQFF